MVSVGWWKVVKSCS